MRTWPRIGKEPAWGWCHMLRLTPSPSCWVGPRRWARSPLLLPAAWKGHQPAPHTLALVEQLQRPGEKVAGLQKAVPEPRGLQVHLACGDRKPEALAAQQPRDRQRRVAQWDLLASVARGPRPRVEGPTDVLPYQQSAPPLPVGRVSKSFRWDSPGLRQQEAPLDGPGQEHEGGFPVQAAGTWGQGSRGGGRRRMGAPGGWHLCGHSGLMMWSG